jgi:hypothetical protein
MAECSVNYCGFSAARPIRLEHLDFRRSLHWRSHLGYLLDNDLISAMQVIEADDDATAVLEADNILASSPCAAAEIWDRDCRVSIFSRRALRPNIRQHRTFVPARAAIPCGPSLRFDQAARRLPASAHGQRRIPTP